MTKLKTPKYEGEIHLYNSPWAPGTRALNYLGSVECEYFIADEDITANNMQELWSDGLHMIIEEAKSGARDRGANAIMGLEIVADPFYEEKNKKGFHICLKGTPSIIEHTEGSYEIDEELEVFEE